MKANHIGDVDVSVLDGMRKIVCSSRDGVTQKTMKLVFDGSHAALMSKRIGIGMCPCGATCLPAACC